MAINNLNYNITRDQIFYRYHYDPDFGLFYQKLKNGTIKSKPAGALNKAGYRVIGLNGACYAAHRLVWAAETGIYPKHDIDHINGKKDDNRFCNLREATASQNIANSRISKNNTTGYKGVSFWIRDGKYTAQCVYKGKRHFLGYFDCPKMAHEAYKEAAKRFHGEYARFK